MCCTCTWGMCSRAFYFYVIARLLIIVLLCPTFACSESLPIHGAAVELGIHGNSKTPSLHAQTVVPLHRQTDKCYCQQVRHTAKCYAFCLHIRPWHINLSVIALLSDLSVIEHNSKIFEHNHSTNSFDDDTKLS